MPDEALLIGQEQPAPQGSTGIQVPMDFVTVEVFAVYKDEYKADPASTTEEYVVQEYKIKQPRGTAAEDTAQFIWLAKIMQQASIRTVGAKGEVNIYPLDRFKRFAVNVGTVVGVEL